MFQGTTVNYVTIPVRDHDRYVVSLGYVRALRYSTDPIFYATVYGGVEDDTLNSVGSRQFAHDLYGARIGDSSQLPSIHRNVRGFVNLTVEQREYHGQSTFFFVDRNDTQFIASFGLEWDVLEDWRVIPEVTIIKNDSNIVLNEYDRVVAGVRVRYSF